MWWIGPFWLSTGIASLSGRTGVSQLKSVGTGRAIPNISYNSTQINSSAPSASVSGQKLGQQNTVKPLQATQILNHASGKGKMQKINWFTLPVL